METTEANHKPGLHHRQYQIHVYTDGQVRYTTDGTFE